MFTVVAIKHPSPDEEIVLHYQAQSVAFRNKGGVMSIQVDEPIGGVDDNTGARKVRAFVMNSSDYTKIEVFNADGTLINHVRQEPVRSIRDRTRNASDPSTQEADKGLQG